MKKQTINRSLFTSFVMFSMLGNAQTLETQFQHILDSVYLENDSAVGVFIHVEAPDQEISWTSAVGISDKISKQNVNKNQPVLIASNTKTYVSAAILRLVEEKMFKLDDPIYNLVHKNTLDILRKDGYKLEEITVRHLLSHTSGIADYVNDAYFEYINTHPQHKWKRSEQIQLAAEVGEPLYAPGTGYTYGDINFLLLTEIIEQKTELPFYQAISQLLEFKKHQLNHTWFVDLDVEPKDLEPFAHQYYDKYNWDSYKLNPSWDLYGGGGLASTVKDLGVFFNVLFNGKIIKDKALLKEMHTFVLPKDKSIYCLGLMKISFHGKEAYYHGGFWGTDVMYIPELNVTISAFTLQKEKRGITNPEISQLILRLIEAQ